MSDPAHATSIDVEEINDRRQVIADMLSKLGMSKFRDIPFVKVEDAMSEPGHILVDVRSDEERQISTIVGAISQAEYESNVAAYADKVIVAFDTVGYGSAGKPINKLHTSTF